MVDTFEGQFGRPSTIEPKKVYSAEGTMVFEQPKVPSAEPVDVKTDSISQKIQEIIRGERDVTPEAAAKQAAFRVSQHLRQAPIVGA